MLIQHHSTLAWSAMFCVCCKPGWYEYTFVLLLEIVCQVLLLNTGYKPKMYPHKGTRDTNCRTANTNQTTSTSRYKSPPKSAQVHDPL